MQHACDMHRHESGCHKRRRRQGSTRHFPQTVAARGACVVVRLSISHGWEVGSKGCSIYKTSGRDIPKTVG